MMNNIFPKLLDFVIKYKWSFIISLLIAVPPYFADLFGFRFDIFPFFYLIFPVILVSMFSFGSFISETYSDSILLIYLFYLMPLLIFQKFYFKDRKHLIWIIMVVILYIILGVLFLIILKNGIQSKYVM